MLLRVAVNHAARGFASVSKVGVMGLGLMGHGVAQVSAQCGFEVVAVEQTEEFCAHGKSLIDKSLAKVQGRKVKKGVLTQEEADAETSEILGRLTFSTELEAFADCDLIIEVLFCLFLFCFILFCLFLSLCSLFLLCMYHLLLSAYTLKFWSALLLASLLS